MLRWLGQRLLLQKSTVKRQVQQLQQRGWVRHEADQRDGRASRVRLTSEGKHAPVELADARTAKFAHLLDRIPAADRRQVLHALDVLTEALDVSHD
jgi:DNA-binding MarR family transcriptional regulator